MCGGLGGLTNFLVATDTASAQAKVNKAKTAARDARNERSAAETELARFQQSLSNKKAMDTAGRNFAAAQENLARRMDAATFQGIMAEVSMSEEMGAMAAATAASGLGGSSIEQYNSTMQTVAGLREELQDRATATEEYGSRLAMGRIIPNAVDALDRTMYNANIDVTDYGPTKGPSLLGNLATLAVAAGATALGAPEVGNMVLKARTAGMQSSYGDAAGATASFQGALTSFKAGVGEVRDFFRPDAVRSGLDMSSINLDDWGKQISSQARMAGGSVTFR